MSVSASVSLKKLCVINNGRRRRKSNSAPCVIDDESGVAVDQSARVFWVRNCDVSSTHAQLVLFPLKKIEEFPLFVVKQ